MIQVEEWLGGYDWDQLTQERPGFSKEVPQARDLDWLRKPIAWRWVSGGDQPVGMPNAPRRLSLRR